VAFGIMPQGIYQHIDIRHSAYFDDDKRKVPHALLRWRSIWEALASKKLQKISDSLVAMESLHGN
jgi:hypothetical protein